MLCCITSVLSTHCQRGKRHRPYSNKDEPHPSDGTKTEKSSAMDGVEMAKEAAAGGDDAGNGKIAKSMNDDDGTKPKSEAAIKIKESTAEVGTPTNATDPLSSNAATAPSPSAAIPTTTSPTTQQPPQLLQTTGPQIIVTTPPKISLPTGQHTHSAPAPQLGPGWTQQLVQRRTPSGPYGKVDRYYVAPDGKRKLRSMAEVSRYMNSLGMDIIIGGNTNAGNHAVDCYRPLRINAASSAAANSSSRSSNPNSRASSTNNSPRPPPISASSTPHNLSPRPPPSTAAASAAAPAFGPGSGKGIDVHPFSRGSVIEVRYVKRKEVVKGDQLLVKPEDGSSGLDGLDDGYKQQQIANNMLDDDESISDWFESSSDEEDEMENGAEEGDNGGSDKLIREDAKKNSKNSNKHPSNDSNVYLADIIDRSPIHPHLPTNHAQQSFKYYIHYRDFNRRMDEWITPERIVSPPSVGNARVRAIKRREDRRKRDEEERKERERILNEAFGPGSGLGVTARRESTVRNRVVDQDPNGSAVESGIAAGAVIAGGGGASVVVGGAVPRKRLRRAASSGITDEFGDANAAAAAIATTDPANTAFAEAKDLANRRPRRGSSEANAPGATSGGVGVGAASTSGASTTTGGSGALAAPPVAEEHTAVNVVTTIAAQVLDEHEGMDAAALKEHEEVTKIKNVNTLELGKYQMDTWYFSPLPKELMAMANNNAGGGTATGSATGSGGGGGNKDAGNNVIDVLYVDEFSLNFFTRKEELLRYQQKTILKKGGGRRRPPGNEIYRCGNLSMFEVDGFEERNYCQNLCYIAKLFLDHKTLYFDVDPFLFYVLCEVDERGFHPVGYYSKEKYSDVGYNLACILTFPSHQRKGYGRFLIAFSYELSKKEEKVGSPEKPMSDLGQQAYIPYWTSTIVDFLLHHSGDCKSMSIMDIAKMTSIMTEDIIFSLNTLGLLKFVNGVYFIYAEEDHLKELAKTHPVKEPRVDPRLLHWTPYLNDVKRDKFSISSKKPSVEAVIQTMGNAH